MNSTALPGQRTSPRVSLRCHALEQVIACGWMLGSPIGDSWTTDARLLEYRLVGMQNQFLYSMPGFWRGSALCFERRRPRRPQSTRRASLQRPASCSPPDEVFHVLSSRISFGLPRSLYKRQALVEVQSGEILDVTRGIQCDNPPEQVFPLPLRSKCYESYCSMHIKS